MKAIILLALSLPAYGQYTSYVHANPHGVVTVINTETLSSNNNDSAGVTPIKKQLANCATGFSGGQLQPFPFPTGQLWCTAAAKTSGEGAGGPTQGVVSATGTGTGVTAVDNGHGAGGLDSPAAMTDTYGGNADDAVCSGDTNNALATPYTGLAPASCVANASAVFAESTASSHGNSDVLFPSIYVSNSTTLDTALYVYVDQYFCVDDLATLHDFEFEPNVNSSPTAYGAANGAFFGWGFHWNENVQMFQYCPQNCSGWLTLKGIDVTGANPDLTSYPLTNGHCYRSRNYDHRMPNCTFASSSNCAFYDYFTIYDVTAGAAPITYRWVDAGTGLPVGFIPVDLHTFASGVYDQVQLDMTSADTLTQVRVISHTMKLFAIQ